MITLAKTRDGKATIYGYGWYVGGPISTYHGLRKSAIAAMSRDSQACSMQ
jgi:hypothetical protein